MNDVIKQRIDAMSHYDLCEVWRFGSSDDATLEGDYLKNRLFNEFGGFTPEISKRLGWD